RRMARHGDSRPAWLIEGRLPEVPRRSEVWRPAAAARNRRLGRSESAFTRVLDALWTPPAGHYDPAARSSLYGAGGNAGSQKRGPRPQKRHGGAPRGERVRQDAPAPCKRGFKFAPRGAPSPLGFPRRSGKET